jgi:hypothetical protein
VLQFLGGVLLQFAGNVHVLGALEELGVNHVSDDRLLLAREVSVEQFDQPLAREGGGNVVGRALRGTDPRLRCLLSYRNLR